MADGWHRFAPQLDDYQVSPLVIEDREIWACASQLLRQHGGDARLIAGQRAEQLLALGEDEGHRTFMRILDRIHILEASTPTGAIN